MDLVIFDNDGTLSDSEFLNNKVVSDILMSYGFDKYTPEYCVRELAGKSMPSIKEAIEQEYNTKLPENFIQEFIEQVSQQIPIKLQPVRGAVEAVKELAKSYKICVASNGEAENVEACIEKIGLMPVFGRERIFTKSLVARGKPSPDLFLYAAKRMETLPDRAIVIEDTVAGVCAGVAAGMHVLGITAVSHHPEDTAKSLLSHGAKRVFSNWSEIMDYIKMGCG
ncbi:MAG: HAD-IA family hydrolase [Pseudobdellovibrionaceae bacterium]|jgi:HAD superfamily hydrolase (TIGR01509 family)|nr:HAD-IA family hydrolase [Pseudobdellovibrionaceae bacterium]